MVVILSRSVPPFIFVRIADAKIFLTKNGGNVPRFTWTPSAVTTQADRRYLKPRTSSLHFRSLYWILFSCSNRIRAPFRTSVQTRILQS
jgi:hypothetical protein